MGYSETDYARMSIEDIIFKLKIIDIALLQDHIEMDIYFIGGAAALLSHYSERYTKDIDFIDIGYSAYHGKYLDLLGTQTDILEFRHTSIASSYRQRSQCVFDGTALKGYVLSKEDMIVSKLCRYAPKDQEDIENFILTSNREVLVNTINEVLKELPNRSPKIQESFISNLKIFCSTYQIELEG